VLQSFNDAPASDWEGVEKDAAPVATPLLWAVARPVSFSNIFYVKADLAPRNN
jgi:hypothetical protein